MSFVCHAGGNYGRDISRTPDTEQADQCSGGTGTDERSCENDPAGEHERIGCLHEGTKTNIDKKAGKCCRSLAFIPGEDDVGKGDACGNHNESCHINGAQEAETCLFHFQKNDRQDRGVIDPSDDRGPDQNTCQSSGKNRIDTDGCIDGVADQIAKPQGDRRDEKLSDQSGSKAAESSCGNVCGSAWNIVAETEDTDVIGEDSCHDTDDQSADDTAVYSQYAGYDTGDHTDLIQAGYLFGRNGADHHRNSRDKGIKHVRKSGKHRDFAEGKAEGHGNKRREAGHHDPTKIDSLPDI